MKVQCLGCYNEVESATPQAVISGVDICPSCRRLIELGRSVEAKRAEYQRKNEAHTIEQWEMDVLNWLDGLEALRGAKGEW